MLGPFFGKKLSFWPFLDFFTKQIKKSHKISNDGAQNRHQIYYKHLAIISSLGMKKCWDLFLAKNLASTSFYYLDPNTSIYIISFVFYTFIDNSFLDLSVVQILLFMRLMFECIRILE